MPHRGRIPTHADARARLPCPFAALPRREKRRVSRSSSAETRCGGARARSCTCGGRVPRLAQRLVEQGGVGGRTAASESALSSCRKRHLGPHKCVSARGNWPVGLSAGTIMHNDPADRPSASGQCLQCCPRDASVVHRRYYQRYYPTQHRQGQGASARGLRTCGPLVGVAGCRGRLPATSSPSVAALCSPCHRYCTQRNTTILTLISIKLVLV